MRPRFTHTVFFSLVPDSTMCKKGWWWCALSCVKNRLIATGDPWRSASGQPPCTSTIHMYPKNNTQGYENTHPFSHTSFSFPLRDSNWRVEIIAESIEWFILGRGPGFLVVVWFGSCPLPLLSPSCHSFSVFLRVAGWACWRGGGGWGGGQSNHTTARMPGPL